MKYITRGSDAVIVKPLTACALALALAFSSMPQTAFAHHCNGRGHINLEGDCFPDLSPITNPRPTPTPINFTVPEVKVDDDKYDYLYWIAGGVLVLGLAISASSEDAGSTFAPDGSLILQGWRFTDELGGVGMSRLLTERTRLTFATDLPQGQEIKQLRAEVKFSF